ncbi:MAG TPA: hypothetical protein VHF25_08545 [Nitriliruptorales bacterium]|nr:hypothetical protein [Nitriliruptorales bacterium]
MEDPDEHTLVVLVPHLQFARRSRAESALGEEGELRPDEISKRRLQREHLDTGRDLSRSAFRRNVAEHLGVATVAEAKIRPSLITEEQVDAVNRWVAACEVAWMETSSVEQARHLKEELKAERRPPLTKR